MRYTAGLVALLALVLVGSAHGTAYPSPPYDFSHPGKTHVGRSPLFSSLGGNTDRPILVIYARWQDVDYPAGVDAAMVAQRFFGTGFPSITFPSVGDYFRRLSFNKLFLFPAAETQGTPYDGVVQVTVPETKAQFFTRSNGARNKILLQLADPFVDFRDFDLDGSDTLDDLELVVNALEAEPSLPLWQGCGIARNPDAMSLDGIGLTNLTVAMDNTATNLITIIHENAHVTMNMVDLYGFETDGYDLGATTCNMPDQTLFAPSAWHKLHWGWITPTVVSEDGYYDIRRADTTGDAFILYDPDRGTDDYFLLENRRKTENTYERSLSRSGLVIWRVADDQLGVASGIPPIGIVRPTPGTSTWDASNPFAPQRTMSAAWADGTASNVAVRAVGAAGEVMRAYLDVRGPGILVDTYPLDRAGPVQLTAGRENIVDVPVMNTGEACDTFLFQAVSLPVGWTMSQAARILCAGETSFARLIVTPDADAAVGVRTITISGFSLTAPGVATDSPLTVEVVLTPSKVDTSAIGFGAPTGSLAPLSIRLTSATAFPLPLANVPITFTLSGPGGTRTAAATTSLSGFATGTMLLDLPPGNYALTIESARSGAFAPSSTTVPFDVYAPEVAIYSAVSLLETAKAATADAGIRSALQTAVDDLLGNNGGAGTNGALDKLLDDPAGAITKLRSALVDVLAAEALGAGDLSSLKRLLGQTAEAIAVEQYEQAKSAVGDPSAGQAQALARIAGDIQTGREHLQAQRYLEACDSFRQATTRALNLVR